MCGGELSHQSIDCFVSVPLSFQVKFSLEFMQAAT
nr:MAG TPA: hypothetical protein [Caudoviricetes sp.]